jgi:aminoglycoside phosphotransferase (APT) family kinase protein
VREGSIIFIFIFFSSPPAPLAPQAGPWRAVLRKKPPGPILASAHAVEREAALLRAMEGRGVPAPRVLASSDDASIVGTPFYVMQFVDGRVFVDPALPDLAPADRAGVYGELARALAALHAVPPAAVPPLARAAGRPVAAYGAHQVAVWDRQYRSQLGGGGGEGAAAGAPSAAARVLLPEMAALAAYLAAAAPALADHPDDVVVLHGDYRVDNVVFDRAWGGPGLRLFGGWKGSQDLVGAFH